MNIDILTTSDTTVVLYFFLFLFKFLLAITPPIPNNFFVNFDVFIFLVFIFISSVPRIASIGGILDAFIAGIKHDKNIVMPEITTEIKIAIPGTSYTNDVPSIMSTNNKFTIHSKIIIATIPNKIPSGIAIIPIYNPSSKTLLFICFLVAPTDASIPYCFVFSDTEILKLFLITNTLLTTIITIITLAIPYRTPKVLSLRTPSNLNKSALTSTSISFLVSASIVFFI